MMRPRVAGILSAIASLGTGLGGFAADEERPRRRVLPSLDASAFRYHRGGGGNGWTTRLYRKFAANAKARFGLDTLVDGKPDPGVIHAMRNARKRERQEARS